MVTTPALNVVGKAVARGEGPEKVSGFTKYTADVLLPGMLFGKVLRSPYPHARIISIDVSGALEVPGVRAVVTGKDIPGLTQGSYLRDIPVLAWDKVRFIGDRVAAVAADSSEAAEEALLRIVVEYEELPAVYDPLEAIQPGAPLVHENVKEWPGSEQLVTVEGAPNAFSRMTFAKGNVDAGYQQADYVVEQTFRAAGRHNGFIEPHASTVAIDAEGRVQVWTATKSPFGTKSEMAAALGISADLIKVNPINVGGDFGGKGNAWDLPIAYHLAQQSGRPVQIAMSYLEELQAGSAAHPAVVTIKSGVTKDGRIVARTLKVYYDSGAYGGLKPGPTANLRGARQGGGSYRVENTFIETIQVYTNTIPRGFFRAPGAPQVNFAVESHMDELAKTVGMDPGDFRLLNIIRDGDLTAVGDPLRDVQAGPVLKAALEAADWWTPPGPNRGRGVAVYDRHIGAGPSSGMITAHLDGTFTLTSPTFDQGVGTHTVIRQIAAEVLQVPYEQTRVVVSDTDLMPSEGGVGGGRMTNAAGTAFFTTANTLLDKLKSAAADRFECPLEEVAYSGGAFYPREAPQRRVSLTDAIALAGGGEDLTVMQTVDVKADAEVIGYTAQVAEVEVDPETGQFRIVKFVAAHDVGTILNPITHQGQIEGGVVQGIGQAIMEEMPIDEGRILTLHLGDYKLPTIADIPPLTTVLVPANEGPVPYGGKGIGESSNVPTGAAIANAIAAASGARITELPVTAEKVYFALHGSEQ